MALLSVRNLKVDFAQPNSTVHAVRGVSFDVAPGETVALVGESGSGKSVTALSILKLLPPSAEVSGEIFFRDRNLLALPERELRKVRGGDISMIFQEPMSSLNPVHTVGRQIAEVLKLHRGMRDGPARARATELLTQVGIDNPAERLAAYPHQLSGGQRQRVMIAMALANEPALLIADEPTTALDVTVQAQILDLLREIKSRLGMAMLFITHDLGIVKTLADRVAVMTNGEVAEINGTRTLFASPTHPYTRHLLQSEPRGNPPQVAGSAKQIVAAEDLRVWFPVKRGVLRRIVNHIKAVDGVSLSVREGETLGIVGESGSGKSTLGLALARLLSSKGRIAFLGKSLQGLGFQAMRPLRRDLQIVFQDPYGSLSPRMTAAEIVGEGLAVHRRDLDAKGRESLVIRALTEVGLDPETRHRYPHEFSGGQRQRIALARVMVLEPKFVILDEPTSALDMSVQAQVIDLLRELQARHRLTFLFISHDLKVIRALANRVIVMRAGKIVEEGKTSEILATPKSDYTKALLAAAFDL